MPIGILSPELPLQFEGLAYSKSARRDIRYWAMALMGAVFFWAGSTIDPQDNCNESGECAPWLVPLAQVVGGLVGLAGLGHLWANPRRGCMIDPQTGELVWWQGRIASHSGDQGRIDPLCISRIKIVRESESADGVHLYDLDGLRQPYFDSEVIPWPCDKWAQRLTLHWPHIELEVQDSG